MKTFQRWMKETLSGGRWALVIMLSLFLLQGACRQQSSPYDELIKHGFYAYSVSNEELIEREWILRTPIKEKNWDIHCDGGPSAPDNPMIIYYEDKEENLQLTIRISNNAPTWDHTSPTETIALSSPWAKTGSGLAYKDQSLSPLRFEDLYGNQVIVRGNLTIPEKVNLVNQFEYIGSSPENMINPWSSEWCARN